MKLEQLLWDWRCYNPFPFLHFFEWDDARRNTYPPLGLITAVGVATIDVPKQLRLPQGLLR